MKKIFGIFVILFLNIQPFLSAIDEVPPLPPAFEKELKMADEKGDTKFADQFVRMLLVLGLMIVLLWAGMWIVKRMSLTKVLENNQTNSIKILEKRVLSHRTTLYVVDILGQSVVVAESLNGPSILANLSTKHEKEK